jgi:membrane protein implicated in regulation of membrane protease activity
LSERPHRLPLHSAPPDEVEARESAVGRIVDAANQVPRPISWPIGLVAAAVLADRLGLTAPGSGYARTVLTDPSVFLAVRILVVLILLVAVAVTAWVGLSVCSHIRNRRWIRRIAGYEPQSIHRGTTELETGVDQLRGALAEVLDRNAELVVNLEYTDQAYRALDARYQELHAEAGELRRLLDTPPHQQLELGDGG